jgi:uncharacterized phiE125 gp8 family phage protein
MNYDRLKLVTAPSTTVVSVDEVKAQLNITHDDDDALITSLIAVATAHVEGPAGIGVALLTQTWRMSLDRLPCRFNLPLGPVQSVTGITYLDEAGAAQTLAASLYSLDTDHTPAVVYIKPHTTLPVTWAVPGAVKVTFVTGYGDDPADVPAGLRQAIIIFAAYLFENRESGEVPSVVEALLDRHRAVAFG